MQQYIISSRVAIAMMTALCLCLLGLTGTAAHAATSVMFGKYTLTQAHTKAAVGLQGDAYTSIAVEYMALGAFCGGETWDISDVAPDGTFTIGVHGNPHPIGKMEYDRYFATGEYGVFTSVGREPSRFFLTPGTTPDSYQIREAGAGLCLSDNKSQEIGGYDFRGRHRPGYRGLLLRPCGWPDEQEWNLSALPGSPEKGPRDLAWYFAETACVVDTPYARCTVGIPHTDDAFQAPARVVGSVWQNKTGNVISHSFSWTVKESSTNSTTDTEGQSIGGTLEFAGRSVLGTLASRFELRYDKNWSTSQTHATSHEVDYSDSVTVPVPSGITSWILWQPKVANLDVLWSVEYLQTDKHGTPSDTVTGNSSAALHFLRPVSESYAGTYSICDSASTDALCTNNIPHSPADEPGE